MRGRRGVWTPGADPLLVLGAHARTEAERRRFAEAFVRAEHERVEGELAFERAVQAAWARLFPGELRLEGPVPRGGPARALRPRVRSGLCRGVRRDGCARTRAARCRWTCTCAAPRTTRRFASGPGATRSAGGGRARGPRHGQPRRRVRARPRARGMGAPGRAVGAGRMRPRGSASSSCSQRRSRRGGVCAASEGLVVVHDAGGTVPAAPYVERPGLSEAEAAAALQRARGRLADPRATARAPGPWSRSR